MFENSLYIVRSFLRTIRPNRLNEHYLNDTPKHAPGPENSNFPSDPHIMDYLLLIAKHKWAVLFILFVSGAAALGLTYIVPYSFESEVMLLPPDRASSAGLLAPLNASGALKILKEVENPSVDVIQNLLESEALSERLFRDSAIHRYFARPGESYQQMVGRVRSSIVTLPGFTEVNVLGTIKTPWFSTAREQEDARHLASYVANLACRTMDTMLDGVLRSDANRARIYADSDYTRRARELDSLDGVKERFEERYGVPALHAQTLETIGEIGRLEGEEESAQIHLNLLERDFSGGDPRVQAAVAELEEARAARDRFDESFAIGPGLDTLPKVARGYAEILRKEAVLEPIITFLREERDQQDIFAERERSVITIVDTAKVPDGRFGPKRVPMLALGLSGGGFLSILYLALVTFLASARVWRISNGAGSDGAGDRAQPEIRENRAVSHHSSIT